ncbi:unnamed protein product [Protopolystoma xenopodis]|uniref:Uncharacterized protein n=1 Tax=Protopolystoma xenopodis TaxID=117903 RepID=A0A3S5B6N7_9PLAT|nr:unnamed protein product [Protopolystoma xenopodis]
MPSSYDEDELMPEEDEEGVVDFDSAGKPVLPVCSTSPGHSGQTFPPSCSLGSPWSTDSTDQGPFGRNYISVPVTGASKVPQTLDSGLMPSEPSQIAAANQVGQVSSRLVHTSQGRRFLLVTNTTSAPIGHLSSHETNKRDGQRLKMRPNNELAWTSLEIEERGKYPSLIADPSCDHRNASQQLTHLSSSHTLDLVGELESDCRLKSPLVTASANCPGESKRPFCSASCSSSYLGEEINKSKLARYSEDVTGTLLTSKEVVGTENIAIKGDSARTALVRPAGISRLAALASVATGYAWMSSGNVKLVCLV